MVQDVYRKASSRQANTICPDICLPPACACSLGYYRDNLGECVSAGDCPLKCGENEQINSCGNRCEPTCENAYGQPKICVLICDPPACVCRPNYYRQNGKCVPQRECPPPNNVRSLNYADELITPPANPTTPRKNSYVDEPITRKLNSAFYPEHLQPQQQLKKAVTSMNQSHVS
ncbi:unnamed protein product [Strongylus vulgaris]|uniref:TIL domain-containing protein n=1 Tax=Strongylus vulgaris TaxID=40348 RepID=A0A3P7J255_STRVU|nr:unnamed protein product [Strongylus vulgaris]